MNLKVCIYVIGVAAYLDHVKCMCATTIIKMKSYLFQYGTISPIQAGRCRTFGPLFPSAVCFLTEAYIQENHTFVEVSSIFHRCNGGMNTRLCPYPHKNYTSKSHPLQQLALLWYLQTFH